MIYVFSLHLCQGVFFNTGLYTHRHIRFCVQRNRCSIHGFKLALVNGFTTGLCSMGSFMSLIATYHETLMKMLAGYNSKCFFVSQKCRIDNHVIPSGSQK